MLTWIWNQIAVTLPEDWEMLQFSRDPDRGRCAFADRYRYRFELNWSKVSGEPDFVRMMSDYSHKLEADGKMTDIRDARLCGCPGLIGQSPEGPVSRFGTWIESQSCLLEVVFLWPEERDIAVEKEVLRSLRPSETESDGMNIWRAFGMELRVPESLSLESCSIQAARAGFLFRGKSPAETWVFRRYGMVDSWLKTDLDAWLKSQLPADIKDINIRHSTEGSIETTHLSGRYLPSGLLHKRGLFEAAAWQHPMDRRLYLAMLTNPRKSSYAGTDPAKVLKSAPEFTALPASGIHTSTGTPSANARTWEPMLKAVLVRNTAATVEPRMSDRSLSITIPSRKPRWAFPPITWIVHPPEKKTLELDPVGADVWNACDNRRSTEEVIDFFARKHSLTFHESRVSVTTYIKMLVQRGALAVAME
ncbi:MAG: PqqD family protein [Verrucomicrobia bacterium]|nr:PqqD family protein [Verrucomicrobiota bacterium]